MRHLLCGAILCATALAGCQPSPTPATAQDLKVTLIADVPLQGGLPDRLKLVIENISRGSVRLIAPRPLYPEDAVMRPQPPPILRIKFRECDETYWPIYTDAEARRTPAPVFVLLSPGQQWSREYRLKDFCFWGPCGPASDTDLGKYYGSGKRELHMSAALFLGWSEKNEAESPPIVVQCALKEGMLKADEPRQK